MSVKHIIDVALEKARGHVGGAEKVASAGQRDLTKEAHQAADALEYLSLDIVDDGTAAGAASRRVVEDFFKRAEKGASPGESVSPTGTQATPPQAGAKKILPTGQAKGNSPAESGAPTGTQATIGQPPHEKKGGGPVTLLDLLTKQGDSPTQSVALQDAADPGRQNENANVKLLESEQSVVNATKRDAKMPTRARLKALFASASDTGPSSAAAKAAFPNAYAKGGMKVAEADEKKCEKCGKEPCECKPEAKKEAELSEGQRRSAEMGAVGAALSPTSPLSGLLAGRSADKGHGWRAAGGATAGHMAGGLAGMGLARAGGGGLGAMMLGSRLGGAAGAAVGGAAGHGKDKKKDDEKKDKEASLSDYASLFDKAASGELGEEAKAFAAYIEQVQI